jgi:Fe-S-cluster-containing hydrogenase component 2/CRP-like cAMP-binding protein
MPDRANLLKDSLFGREGESLFARDEHDMLIRREQETRKRFSESVTILIDGFPIEIPRAVPKTDAQNNPLRDANNQLIPRTTTIYDAALKLVAEKVWSEVDLKNRIPILCHQPHMQPVGMCRMCSVHICSIKRGKLTPGRRLVPSCQHRVEKDMVVTTRAGVDGYNPETWKNADLDLVAQFSEEVNNSVRILGEFLVADHLQPNFTPVKRFDNELANVARVLEVSKPRDWIARKSEHEYSRNRLHTTDPVARRISLPLVPTNVQPEGISDTKAHDAWEEWNQQVDTQFPYSSLTVVVDHDRCILCDRCTRACSEVRPFKVLGHTGKGYKTRISFDLDQLMGNSGCVQCAECMISCPTGALSLRRRVQPRSWEDSLTQIPLNPNTPFPAGSGFLTADEMLDVWLYYISPTSGPKVVYPFRSIPYAYLKWNEGSVRRWVVPAGQKQLLCREGEYGSTAFLLQGGGKFSIYSGGSLPKTEEPSFFQRLLGKKGNSKSDGDLGRLVATRSGTELIFGEMACISHRPRTATVIAEADPNVPALELISSSYGWPTVRVVSDAKPTAIFYEITRNLLDMMQRSGAARECLEEIYTSRAVESAIIRSGMSAGLPSEQQQELCQFLLKSRQLEFRRVEPGELIVQEGETAYDFYFIRHGTVRIFRTVSGREQIIGTRSSNEYVGAIALLSREIRQQGLVPTSNSSVRPASVAAIDPVEVVRVPGKLFRDMCNRFPTVRERLIEESIQRIREADSGPFPGVYHEYVNQGLFQAQKLLVLDLTSCTRCDECTRACADSHDGHSRLLREGLRFGDFLVATSCRSCEKPYCMEGCPVDAIHRRGDHLEVVIENHCIGCSLCEKNCPYGAIQMVPKGKVTLPTGVTHIASASRRAANCDLCNGGKPYCVKACPHEAAFRMSGPTLFNEVIARRQREEQQ